ncbi:histidine-containing response regulator phosphotransferase Mpr1, partial [Schizosaccharomyces japonicus yFS275]
DKELEYIEMIDRTTFDQLLEMDDDDNHEFSKSIVSNYNEQATTTLDQLQEALDKRDLSSVSSLGHFLKGSSAALGLNRMKRACELIQRFGACKSSNGTDPLPDDNVAVDLLTKAMAVVRKVYADSEEYLRHVFD